jgi:hypothetical protein
MITKPKKKLNPASIISQKRWQSFSVTKKNKLRKMLSDRDKDGVPNKFDCHPNNKRKQENFLSQDMAYLNSGPDIQLGEKISSGGSGDVFSVAGNKNLVVKIPKYMIGSQHLRNGKLPPSIHSNDLSASTRQSCLDDSCKNIKYEADLYKLYNLNNEPLFIPTAIKQIDCGTRGKCIGMVRPVIRPFANYGRAFDGETIQIGELRGYQITDSQIEDIRRKIIQLSHKGYSFHDGLQIGMDKAGRFLIFDTGGVKKELSKSSVFTQNNYEWKRFLSFVRKESDGTKKYGSISMSENY